MLIFPAVTTHDDGDGTRRTQTGQNAGTKDTQEKAAARPKPRSSDGDDTPTAHTHTQTRQTRTPHPAGKMINDNAQPLA